MYTFDSRIRYSEVSSDSKLTLLSLLNYFQDCSTFHSEDIGVGLTYLKKRHMAWVLNFWQIDIERYADLCEHVTIETHPYDFKACLGFRNFSMTGQDGSRIAVANSLWTLLDLDTMGPARPPEDMISAYQKEPKADMEYLPRKLKFTGEGTSEEPILVREHHLDTNNHVNNGQYVMMAYDFLEEGSVVKRLRVTYQKSAVLQDLIYPVVYRQQDGSIGVSLNTEEGTPYSQVEFFLA